MSAMTNTHGMNGQLVAPDWPPISVVEASKLLSRYPQCGRVLGVGLASPRPFSAAAVVMTEAGPVFVKRHDRRVRDSEGLLEEHLFVQHLHAHGAQVPAVLADAEGCTAVESDGWICEVHEVPRGVDLYGSALSWTPFRSTAHAHAAGAALARMHSAAADFTAARRAPRPLVASFTIFAEADPKAGLQHFFQARPAIGKHAEIRQHAYDALGLLAPFHAELLTHLPALKPLWTHNDLHASNLFWANACANAAATAIIDFGLCDKTNAVHDIAHAVERNIMEWLALVDDPFHPDAVPVHTDHLLALLNGYERVRPLTDTEAAALAPMIALCHAEFALSEADYFFGVLASDERARMAFDGWLVGHARWFRSHAGMRLLDTVRRWAVERRSLS